MAFMSMRLLSADEENWATIHTALDDLESFLWLLIWGIVHASKNVEGAMTVNKGIPLMLNAWSGDVKSNLNKFLTAERSWRDAVFGGLIEEWLSILNKASKETMDLVDDLPEISLNNEEGSEWRRACDRLESYCMETYEGILKSGFEHLKKVQKFSNWTEVVAATAKMRTKKY